MKNIAKTFLCLIGVVYFLFLFVSGVVAYQEGLINKIGFLIYIPTLFMCSYCVWLAMGYATKDEREYNLQQSRKAEMWDKSKNNGKEIINITGFTVMGQKREDITVLKMIKRRDYVLHDKWHIYSILKNGKGELAVAMLQDNNFYLTAAYVGIEEDFPILRQTKISK